MLVERGLTVGTARGYVDNVRPFVATRLRGSMLELAGISAADVTGFVSSACPGRAVGSAKLVVCALRSLLRWLHLTGQLSAPLVEAVPAVAGWKLSNLPEALEPGQLGWLLASCDRRTAAGRRDYAVLLLLSRLGLRAGEVARLGLDEIDWRHGEVTVIGRATGVSGCRCRPMSGRRSRRICDTVARLARKGAACSCECTRRYAGRRPAGPR